MDKESGLVVDGATAVVSIVCRACDREVPISEAVVPEAADYVVYLCGLDCYQRWIAARGATSNGDGMAKGGPAP